MNQEVEYTDAPLDVEEALDRAVVMNVFDEALKSIDEAIAYEKGNKKGI